MGQGQNMAANSTRKCKKMKDSLLSLKTLSLILMMKISRILLLTDRLPLQLWIFIMEILLLILDQMTSISIELLREIHKQGFGLIIKEVLLLIEELRRFLFALGSPILMLELSNLN
jgi:hypothetical protein